MIYDSDLRFLCDTLKKARIQVRVISPDKFSQALAERGVESSLGHKPEVEAYARLLASPVNSKTIYNATDPYGLRYIYFSLPSEMGENILLIGPYLLETVRDEWLLSIGEACAIAPSKQKYLKEYFSAIPVIENGNIAFAMIYTFCEHLWQTPSFTVTDINATRAGELTPLKESVMSDGTEEVIINIKAMEQRYAFENELIDAVALGQLHKQNQLVSAFNDAAFEARMPDRLRNAKNYGIIMNTLLRKAAERGGVHPIDIDKVSSEIAVRIERMSDVSDNRELMLDIFRTYCRLVHQHSVKNYSPVVQKTIILIDSDLSADLSLSALARTQNISPGYLCTVFKNETGKNISEYVRERRIAYATHMLKTTNLQIQTVALHCGIVDMQYFSKIFKRIVGMTPREYRESQK